MSVLFALPASGRTDSGRDAVELSAEGSDAVAVRRGVEGLGEHVERLARVGDLEAAVGPLDGAEFAAVDSGSGDRGLAGQQRRPGVGARACAAEVVAVSLLKLYSVAVRAPPGNGLPSPARTVELPAVSLVTVIGPVTGTPVGARVSQTPKAGGSMRLSPLLVPDGVPAARSNANSGPVATTGVHTLVHGAPLGETLVGSWQPVSAWKPSSVKS